MSNYQLRLKDIYYWVVKMLDLYGENKIVYVAFDHRNHILFCTFEPTILEYMDKSKTKTKRTRMKYLYHYVLQSQHESIDEFVIFLIAYKAITQISTYELSKKLEIDKKKLVKILNGSVIKEEEKKSFCHKLQIKSYNIIKDFNVYFID